MSDQLSGVNKTLYIPLYGKAVVSRKGTLLRDVTAEEIWNREGFALHGKAASKWLAYYMAMRARVFDDWLCAKLAERPDAVVLHIGCGLDSRIHRVGSRAHTWYDIDFPSVIAERSRYFDETDRYHLLAADARRTDWIDALPAGDAIVVMEGVSMYMQCAELTALFCALGRHFSEISLLVDCYTEFAAKASKYKNPVNAVGVTTLYGIDDPRCLETDRLRFTGERSITPPELTGELTGPERPIFRAVYAGSLAKKLYRLYEYGTE